MTSGSPAPISEVSEQSAAWRKSGAARRVSPLKLTPLPAYDVRIKRELAHRRLVVSIVRRLLRLLTLHSLDAACVAASALFAGRLSGATGVGAALPALVAFVLVGLHARSSYRPGPPRRDAQRVVSGVLIATLLAIIPTTLPPALKLTPEFFIYFPLATCVALIVERSFVDLVVRQAYVRGLGLRRALVVSPAREATEVIAGLHGSAQGTPGERPVDQLVLGFITPDSGRDAQSLGSLSRLEDALDTNDVSELVIATSLPAAQLARVAETCFERGVQVFVIPPAAHQLDGWTDLTHVGRWPAYHLHPARLELPALILKRATDLLLATTGLVLVAPLIAVIAGAIRIESRGPVFFRQRRVGLGGREFMMWKFRSMWNEAEALQPGVAHLNPYVDGRLFKLAEDPRITRVGRLLRRFSLDELPQLLNVLVGEMSLVGPRPPLPTEVSTYEARHFVRLSVVPGMTGPWQVNGRNLITDFEQVVQLERTYIENWSLRTDLEIMLRTLGVVLSGRGAY